MAIWRDRKRLGIPLDRLTTFIFQPCIAEKIGKKSGRDTPTPNGRTRSVWSLDAGFLLFLAMQPTQFVMLDYLFSGNFIIDGDIGDM
ncbi:MAG: hypothetical protein AAGJ18_15050 [Bacteroidota bacterium]